MSLPKWRRAEVLRSADLAPATRLLCYRRNVSIMNARTLVAVFGGREAFEIDMAGTFSTSHSRLGSFARADIARTSATVVRSSRVPAASSTVTRSVAMRSHRAQIGRAHARETAAVI